jgi:hypothetical protein
MKLVLLATLLLARDAYASRSCGSGTSGGSSSSSSSGSSDSSSSSSSSGSTATAAPACIDDTDVVGYKQCTKFGQRWGMHPRVPRFSVEMGTNIRQFAGTSGTGSVWHGAENFAFRMVTPTSSEGATAIASTLRMGVGLPHGLYTGIEGEFGALTTAPGNFQMSDVGTFGTPEVTERSAMLFGGTAFLGTRISSGRLSLALEGAGGVRSVRYRATSTYHNCVDTATVTATQGVLEARARAELWLNPWFTLGAQAGANVVAKGDWMTGVFIGIHNRAFGGNH